MKICGICKEEKDLTEFYKHNRDGYRSECKKCSAKNKKRYYKKVERKYKNVCEKCGKRKRKQRFSFDIHGNRSPVCKKCVRGTGIKTIHQIIQKPKTIEEKRANSKDWVLKRKYGISLEQYNVMLLKQGGVCAICKKPPGKKSLHVDHCHKTGKVRQLLCSNCNTLLGQSRDSIEYLQKLIEYLKTNGETKQ